MADIEPRVAALEANLRDIIASLARIEEKQKATATSAEIGYLRGRVEALPTTWQTIAIMVSLVGAMAAIAFGAMHLRGTDWRP